MTLVAVDGFGTRAPEASQTVTFVLAQDLTQNGAVLAHAGDIASAQANQAGPTQGNSPPGVNSVALQHVMLRAGAVSIPLRSNQVRGTATPVQYQELPGSGKVEITLFVAADVPFPKSQ